MAKKKTTKRKRPVKRKIRGGSLKTTMIVDEFNLLPLNNDMKVKRNIFKRFKDWLGNAWFVFFNGYGG
jgi:hypothetical protein